MLLKRVLSAIAAAILLLAIAYFGEAPGLVLISTAVIGLAVIEYTRMAFTRFEVPQRFLWLFAYTCLSLYVSMLLWPELASLSLAISNCLFLSGALWLTRSLMTNERLLPAMAMGSLGLLYCVSLPVFAVKLIFLPDGEMWYLFLLLVVFFGDTFAYFGGRFAGRRKLMPQVSPNKTIEGAVAGLIGSTVAGSIFVALRFPHVPIWQTILFCVLCGMVAQSGDLLMSLVKRVAQVKDSGSIMPGHGGILDRLDGIFVSCPLVYAFALWS